MEIYIDSADLEAIREIGKTFPIDGITTNPGILAGCGAAPEELFPALRTYTEEKQLRIFVQVTASSAEGMLLQALRLREYFGSDLVAKIPAVEEGYRAVPLVREQKIDVCVTVVHSPTQALIAAKAGAQYVAPYISHIDNLGGDGVNAVWVMRAVFASGGYDCKVLGASFRTARQIERLAEAGCEAVTITPPMYKALVAHDATDASMVKFRNAWKSRFGETEVDEMLKTEGGR